MSAAFEGAPAPASPATRPARRIRRRHWLRPIALLAILIVAFGFRTFDLNWDQNRNLHPDERYVAVLTSVIKPPASLSQYFDSGESPFNPINTEWGRSYVYGTLPVFMARYLGEFLDRGCGPNGAALPKFVAQIFFGASLKNNDCYPGEFTGYNLLTLVGRFISALADTLTVLVIYLLGRRLFGWRVGLLAAGLSAITVLQIQQAHFFTVDALATLFTTLTLFFCARMVMRTNRSSGDAARLYLDGLLAGVMAGLAIACKISTWPTVMVLTVAIVIALLRDRRRGWRVVLDAWLALMLAGIFTFVSFRIVQPYAFVGNSVKEFETTIEQCQQLPPGALTTVCKVGAQLPPAVREIFTPSARWINLLNLAQGFVNGTIDAPFAIQWADRMPIVFPLINLVFWGMGIPLAITAIIGFFYELAAMAARPALVGLCAHRLVGRRLLPLPKHAVDQVHSLPVADLPGVVHLRCAGIDDVVANDGHAAAARAMAECAGPALVGNSHRHPAGRHAHRDRRHSHLVACLHADLQRRDHPCAGLALDL